MKDARSATRVEPTIQPEDLRPLPAQRLQRLLDEQLDAIFGPNFAEVLEYEVKRELDVDLYRALQSRPAEAILVLRNVFRREATVALILGALTERLRNLEARSEVTELLAVLKQLKLREQQPEL